VWTGPRSMTMDRSPTSLALTSRSCFVRKSPAYLAVSRLMLPHHTDHCPRFGLRQAMRYIQSVQDAVRHKLLLFVPVIRSLTLDDVGAAYELCGCGRFERRLASIGSFASLIIYTSFSYLEITTEKSSAALLAQFGQSVRLLISRLRVRVPRGALIILFVHSSSSVGTLHTNRSWHLFAKSLLGAIFALIYNYWA